jgi:hypothetical protein
MWHANCFTSGSQSTLRRRITRIGSARAVQLALGPQLSKPEERFMRSLIILAIVVLLKIEQELTSRLAKRAVVRRHRAGALRR